MDFGLTREQEMLRDMVRTFAESELAPKASSLDEKGEFPFDELKKAAKLGLAGIINSKEYGGSEMGHLARMIMIEEISKVYPPLGFCFQTGQIGMYGLQNFGSDGQKKKYLPPLCRGDEVMAWAVTEATGGSDPSKIQTTAELVGDGYVVNGRKVFITAGETASVVGFLAKTGDTTSFFIVEKGTPGFTSPRREESLGLRSIPVSELAFTNCKISKENLLGQEGRGLTIALTGIAAAGRTGAAGVSLGIARGAYDVALKFAKERNLYGKPVAQLQAIQFALVDMNVEIEAAKWLCYYSAWLLDQGKKATEVASEIAMAKLYATDVANRACPKAVQLMGGYGLIPEYQLARRLRDALEILPAAGTQEIMRVVIGAGITR
ncbi:MAG: acyl-CoA dehydrogenase family protein [Chloroflexi bacterium]|nr:acyl-CoA dehydrogenase family protein [Chloroflexota bacterium]